MCGVAGEIRFDQQPASRPALLAMNQAQTARGPDGDGIVAEGPIGLAHRRLSIIDLSDRSRQPLADDELGLRIVFNGIIYNYRALRAELQEKGYRFFSEGDTEVALKAFHAWGEAALDRFHGFFAFAIWDLRSGRVTLARDRLGIKPLYYSQDSDRFRFASTLPALVAAARTEGGLDTGIDPVALHHYMSFHAVVPAPFTILKGVRKVPPATVMVVEPDGTATSRTYWRVEYGLRPEDRGLTEADWRDRVLEALTVAVERRLVADVPVGVLLSGGVDSSLIVGLMAKLGQTAIKTFSIGFEAVGQEKGDEFQYSDLIAERFGTDHRRIFIESARALPALDDCIAAMSEPMVSHDAIGFYLLSQEVAQHVKVVQSGQGADEVFGGYHWYPPMLDSVDPVSDYARAFFDRDHAEMLEALDPRFHGPDHSRAFVRDHFATPGADAPADKALRIDIGIMAVDDPVKRVDNMTMAWGLEARVPFLDHELVELAARVPAELKIKEGGKHVLKEAARQVIPAEVIDRPKGYFPVPALKYLRGDFLDLVRDTLSGQRARERGLFQQGYIDRLLEQPDHHITPLGGSKLWQAALLHLWLDKQGL